MDKRFTLAVALDMGKLAKIKHIGFIIKYYEHASLLANKLVKYMQYHCASHAPVL
jgi:hypothetical protein